MEEAKLVKEKVILYFPSWLIFVTRYTFTEDLTYDLKNLVKQKLK